MSLQYVLKNAPKVIPDTLRRPMADYSIIAPLWIA
jgi:hypothetical protein